MIRYTAASLTLTAVAAAGAVYLAGLIDPATEIICRPVAGAVSGSTVIDSGTVGDPAESSTDLQSDIQSDAVTSRSPRRFIGGVGTISAPITTPAPTRTSSTGPATSSTSAAPETCLPADEITETDAP